jgi:multiple sugar transport system substrate-binding protein
MLAWDFQLEMIEKLVADWSAANGHDVEVAIIPNVGYSAAIQTRLRGGEVMDLYYNFAYNSQKFVDQGWARPLNDLPGVDDLVADLFESARERHVTASGDIISVPYFSAVHMLHYNQRMLGEAGLGAPPASLDEVYSQSKALKEQGVATTPYVAYWVKEFCEEYLHTYLLNEGIEAFDADGAPVFADDPKSEDVLAWWQTMYTEGLTPTSVLSDDPGKLSTTMAQGDAAFFVLHHYFLTSIRDLAGPESENVMQAPITSTNHTLQIGEVLQMGALENQDQREAVWELMKHYGWKDSDDRFTVHTEWAKASGLAAPYPRFFTDPAVIDAFPDYYDLSLLSETFDTGSKVVPARTLAWYPDFQMKVGDIVHSLLLGQVSPKDAVRQLADAAVNAKSSGGGL